MTLTLIDKFRRFLELYYGLEVWQNPSLIIKSLPEYNQLENEIIEALYRMEKLRYNDNINYVIGKLMSLSKGKMDPEHIKLTTETYRNFINGDNI